MKTLLFLISVVALCGAGLLAPIAVAQSANVQVLARGAPIKSANGLYFDKQDRLYIASAGGREIVVMDPDSGKILDRIGPERDVETPDDLTFGPDGSLYWTALMTGEVGKITPDGKKVTVARGLSGANPITFSNDGRLFVARDFMGDGLYELDPSSAKPPRPIDEHLKGLNAFDFGPDGKLYGPLYFEGKLVSIDVDSGARRTVAEGFMTPSAVKFDAQGRLFALDQGQGKVFLVDPTSGEKTEYATIEPGLDNLAFDSHGQLFVSNNDTSAVYQVQTDRSVRTISPGGLNTVGSIAVLPHAGSESVYVPGVFTVTELDGATGRQRSLAHVTLDQSPLRSPLTFAADGARVVVSSWFGNAVQVWDPATNTVSAEYTDVAVPINAIGFQGDIVVAELGTKPPRVTRVSAANPAARTTLAELGVPAGLAATAEDLWASDWAAGTVVQLVKGGQQLTRPAVVASGLKGPEGLAVAADGSLLVVESMASRLSRIDQSSGAVSTVAEGLEVGAAGPPTMPPLWVLDSVAVGPSGAIYVAGDKANELYRIVQPQALPRTGGDAAAINILLAALGGLAILGGVGVALLRRRLWQQ
jgi:sugar lactone lactonase YvrE